MNILGAGPSGLSAAINLAKAGYDIEVFEKRHRVGQRFNGDLQGLENWSGTIDFEERLGEMGIRTNFDLDAFHELTLTNMTKEVHFSFHRPAFYLVKRGPLPGTLDYGLANQARDLGIRIHLRSTIAPERADIVATGPLPGRAFGVVKGISFETRMSDLALAIVGDTVAHRGYAYLLVTKGHGCLCTAVMGRLDKADACLQAAREAFSSIVSLEMENPRRVGGMGSFSATATLQREGRLYVGEAAGIQDLLWGFGIGKALTSGYLAAQSIINDQDYERMVHRVLGGKLKAGFVNRLLWEALHIGDYSPVLGLFGSSRNPLGLLHRLYSHDPLHRAVYPLASAYFKKHYPQLI